MTVRIPGASLVMAACGALVVALTACGSSTASPTASAETASTATASSTTVEVPAPPPSAEPSGPEQPQQPNAEVAVDLASLPVGGGGSLTDNPSCVDVNWGAGSIPDGVRIRITRVEVIGKNGDIHEASGISCQPPCHDFLFAAGGGCQVAVGWTPNSPQKTLTGTIGLYGKCVAPDQPTCDQMQATVASETGPLVTIEVPAQNTSSASSEPPASGEPSASSEVSAGEASASGGS